MSLTVSAYPGHEITPLLAQTAKPPRTLESRWATGFDIPPVIPFLCQEDQSSPDSMPASMDAPFQKLPFSPIFPSTLPVKRNLVPATT
jgi:hypothetical protein